MENIHFFDAFLSQYISDPKWYPYILLGLGIFILVVIYIIFMYVRSFISWIFGINEMVRLQKEQNHLLREILVIQEEQREILESLFIEENNQDNFREDEIDDIDPTEEIEENEEEKIEKKSQKTK